MTGRPHPRRCDRGSATIWVLGGVLLVLALLVVTLVRAAAVLARHRAESAADLAALAAAVRIGTAGDSCAAASELAAHNGARVVACDLDLDADGRSGTVTVRVVATVSLPVVGSRDVSASARAGRLPAVTRDPAATLHGAGKGFQFAAERGGTVWHAFAESGLYRPGRPRPRMVVAWSSPYRSPVRVRCLSSP